MEWYTFGLDRILMFLLAVSSALGIVLAVMFGKDERGPKKYIQMNWCFLLLFWGTCNENLPLTAWLVCFTHVISGNIEVVVCMNYQFSTFLICFKMRLEVRCSCAFFHLGYFFRRSHSWKANWCYCIGYSGRCYLQRTLNNLVMLLFQQGNGEMNFPVPTSWYCLER